MVATDNYKYALINNALRNPISFAIPNWKWQDSNDKGSHRNINSYLTKVDAPKVESPLRKDVKYRASAKIRRQAIKPKTRNKPPNTLDLADKNTHLENTEGQIGEIPKKEKDSKEAVNAFWDKAYNLV